MSEIASLPVSTTLSDHEKALLEDDTSDFGEQMALIAQWTLTLDNSVKAALTTEERKKLIDDMKIATLQMAHKGRVWAKIDMSKWQRLSTEHGPVHNAVDHGVINKLRTLGYTKVHYIDGLTSNSDVFSRDCSLCSPTLLNWLLSGVPLHARTHYGYVFCIGHSLND